MSGNTSIHAVDADNNLTNGKNKWVALLAKAQALWVYIGTIGGERNTNSTTNNYDVIKEECNRTILSNTSANVIGAGGVDDTFLMDILILKNAGPATCTIAGFADQAGAAANIVLTGSTSVDTAYNFKASRNSKGALTITGSVASTVIVGWRPV